MFSGPRGCGKTTAARILAKAVNCKKLSADGEPCCECESCRAITAGDHLDVMEIDAASNRGIDQIRELKSHVGLASFTGGVKLYILDEVHMLTMEAFNALLKTLEEPPRSVMFVFATTEPHKVPVTIRSRCLHIPFHRISTEDMAAHLTNIASMEGFEAEESALWEISRNADGALRDAISMTEQALAMGSGKVSSGAVRAMLGGGSRAEMERLVSSLRDNPASSPVILREILGRGVSPERFLSALYPVFRDMWVYSLWGERAAEGITTSPDELDYLRSEVPKWDSSKLERACSACAALFQRARWGLGLEVFSGLLLFDLLSAAGTASLSSQGAARPVAVTPETAKPAAGAGLSGTILVQSPVEEEEEKREEPPDDVVLPELISRLLDENLTLCAALIDVRINSSGGAVAFDCSEAYPLARAIIDSKSSGAVIAQALGLSPADCQSGSGWTIPDTGTSDPPERRESTSSPSMLEEISTLMNADLLVLKSVLRADEQALDGMEDAELMHDAGDVLDSPDN
jgi:DNA polymerase-3 subunit gamma/tau